MLLLLQLQLVVLQHLYLPLLLVELVLLLLLQPVLLLQYLCLPLLLVVSELCQVLVQCVEPCTRLDTRVMVV